jgi:hypothetical protein
LIGGGIEVQYFSVGDRLLFRAKASIAFFLVFKARGS